MLKLYTLEMFLQSDYIIRKNAKNIHLLASFTKNKNITGKRQPYRHISAL